MEETDPEQDLSAIRQKVRKSNVRIVVTYFVVFVYCTTATILTFVLLWMGKIELAVGVFSGLSTLSAGIAGFWFGNRGNGFPESISAPGSGAAEDGARPIAIAPLIGTARRPADDEAAPSPARFIGKKEEGREK